MNDTGGIPDRLVAESAGQQLDPTDTANLRSLAGLYTSIDPVPEGLVDRLKFGLALDEMMAEVAQLTRTPLDATAVRGEATSTTRTETITFSADELTAMVTVSRSGSGRVRIDGWVAPPTEMKIRLRMQGERRQTSSDDTGRFVIDDLPEGFAQLTFHPSGVAGATAVVVTPLFEL